MFAGTALSVHLFVNAGLSLFIICGPYLSVVVCVFYAYNLTLGLWIQSISSNIYYHTPTKLREGNVFRSVCHSVWRETPPDRAPQGRYPGQRPPKPKIPLDRDPQRQKPSWTKTPDRDCKVTPWTETSHTETSHRDPPEQRYCTQRSPGQRRPPDWHLVVATEAGDTHLTRVHTCLNYFCVILCYFTTGHCASKPRKNKT